MARCTTASVRASDEPRGQLHDRDEVALILCRDEAARCAPELNARQHHEPGVDEEHQARAANHP